VSALPAREAFAERLNTTFAARAEDGQAFELFLIDVESLASSDFQESFSLLFRAPLDAPPAQGTFALAHESLPAMDVFLVPVKKDDGAVYFAAAFNYLLSRS
jgi:hypothetical protein